MEQQVSPLAVTDVGNHPNGSASYQSRLSFDRPVARHLVHRAAMAEVFVSDAFPLDESHYVVGAQWPRDHALYQPGESGLTDSLLFVETFRQTMVYLAHTYQGIPLTHHFIGQRLDFQIIDPAPLRVGAAPLVVLLDSRWTPTGGRAPGRYDFRVDADLVVDGAHAGRASLEVMAVDARRYAMLRGPSRVAPAPALLPSSAPPLAPARGDALALTTPEPAPGIPVPAGEVGRGRARDSVLRRGPKAGQWWLAADPAHAILFDHPTDHIPLMVLAEGFRQLGYLLNGHGSSALLGMTIDCHAFGELDRPLALVVQEFRPAGASGERNIRVDAVQDERCVASCSMRWSSSSSPVLAKSSAPPTRPGTPASSSSKSAEFSEPARSSQAGPGGRIDTRSAEVMAAAAGLAS